MTFGRVPKDQINVRSHIEEALQRDIGTPLWITSAQGVTYPIKKEVWDNWYGFEVLGLERYQKKCEKSGKKVRTFVEGTGSQGVVSAAAPHVFPDLERIVLLDINPDCLEIARANIEQSVQKSGRDIEVIVLCSNMCAALRESGIKADVILENMPNIPKTGIEPKGVEAASWFNPQSLPTIELPMGYQVLPYGQIRAWLLDSHYTYAVDAKSSLTEGGVLIECIGGRVPYHKIKGMIETAGYRNRELVAGFKRQTEVKEVISGHAKVEQFDIVFEFFKYRHAKRVLQKYGMDNPYHGDGRVIKNYLTKEVGAISAREQSKRWWAKSDVGHTVHIIELSPV